MTRLAFGPYDWDLASRGSLSPRGCHRKSRNDFLTARLSPQRVEGTGHVGALVGVGAEVVALALDQGGGQARGAQAVEVLQRGGEHRHRDAECNRTGDHCLLYTSDAADE